MPQQAEVMRSNRANLAHAARQQCVADRSRKHDRHQNGVLRAFKPMIHENVLRKFQAKPESDGRTRVMMKDEDT